MAGIANAMKEDMKAFNNQKSYDNFGGMGFAWGMALILLRDHGMTREMLCQHKDRLIQIWDYLDSVGRLDQ